MMTFATLGRAAIQESRSMPTNPAATPTTIFRWMGAEANHDNLHVVALNPGSQKLGIHVRKEKSGGYAIEVTRPGGRKRTIRLDPGLKLK